MPDHHARAVNAPVQLFLLANQALRFVLGQEVGVIHGPGFLKHVLGEGALVEPRCGDGGHLVEAARVQAPGQGEGLGGTLDVADPLALCIGFHVVDGGQVEEVIDLARVFFDPRRFHSQPGAGQVSLHGDDLVFAGAPQLTQAIDFGHGAASHQQVDRTSAIKQFGTRKRPMKPVPPVTK